LEGQWLQKRKFVELLVEEHKRRQKLPEHGVNRKDFFQSVINSTSEEGFKEGFNTDLAVTAIWASLDTTKSTSLFLINTLIDHEKEWNVVREDHYKAFGPEGISAPDATYTRLQKEVPYSLACLKEVMRYNGVGVMSMRRVKSDIQIVSDGKTYIIPEGYKVCTSFHYQSKDPESKLYSNPTSFIPERFLGDDSEEKMSGCKALFTNFGLGERQCPGNPIARLALEILMALMAKYKWIRRERVKEWIHAPLQCPKGGLWIRAASPIPPKL